MAIFENELIDNKRGSNELPMPKGGYLGSPSLQKLNLDLGGFENFTTRGTSKSGLTVDQMSTLSSIPKSDFGFNSPMQMIPKSELLENQRYGIYSRGVDLENIYGLQQGWASQLANGVAKFVGTGAGTFARTSGFVAQTVDEILKTK